MNLRTTLFSLVMLLPFSLASTAGAIEISVIGSNFDTISPGGTFTINIAVDNLNIDTVEGATVNLTGLLTAGAVAISGVSASSHFVGSCSPSDCSGGIDSIDTPFFNPNDLSASGAYTPGDDLIVILNALALASSTNDGSLDPGLDGALNSPSARDVTIVLTAATIGTHVLTIGGDFSNGAAVLPIMDTAIFTITVPEPGAVTASLAALGTVLLTAGFRRRA